MQRAVREAPEPPSDALLERCATLFDLPDGRQMGYSDVGDEHGHLVLMEHGIPGSRLFGLDFHKWGLKYGVRFVAPDRPGWGLSSPVTRPSQRSRALDVICLLDHLEIGRLATLGFSGGAGYAMALAAALPRRVVAVGLAAACCPWDRSIAKEAALFTRLHRSPLTAPLRGIDALVARAGRRSHSDTWVGELLRGSAKDRDLADKIEAFRQGGSAHRFEWGQVGFWDLPISSVGQPVRLWHGDRDHRASVRLAERVARSLPRGEITIVPGGHYAPGAHSGEWLGWLRDQLP